MKKIGLLALALVLALGALGVGYAAWTDTVTITGNVTTGTVDVVVEDYSNTYVWKTIDDGIYVQHTWDSDKVPYPYEDAIDAFPNEHPLDTGGIDPVASAVASYVADDEVYIDIVNAFPILPEDGILSADFLLHYAGSVPVKVDICDVTATGGLDPEDIMIQYFESDADGTYDTAYPIQLGGLQMHYCDYIVVLISVDLSENEASDQNLESTISGSIRVIQWNEYKG